MRWKVRPQLPNTNKAAWSRKKSGTSSPGTSAKPNRRHPLTDPRSLRRVLRESVLSLNPVRLTGNPTMLVTEIGAAIVTVFSLHDLLLSSRDVRFDLEVALWLWLTVLAGTFAKALATARGLAHTDALRRSRSDLTAKRLVGRKRLEVIPASRLRKGDIVICEAGDLIPAEGEITAGIAIVDESAITGESAPVIRESGGDRSTVSAGTRVVSDQVEIRITATRAETFLERRIGLVEDLERDGWSTEASLQRTLGFVTLGLTVGLLALSPAILRALPEMGRSAPEAALLFVPLLVCLLPTPLAGLLSAINISAVDRSLREGLLPASDKAIEAANEIDTVLVDKTGTATIGNRTPIAFIPCGGVSEASLARAAYLSSTSDETPEGRSIVQFAIQHFGQEWIGPQDRPYTTADTVTDIPFSAYTRMSGVDIGKRALRKGAISSIASWIRDQGGTVPPDLDEKGDRIAREGGTPLAVAVNDRIFGLIHLKDVLRPGFAKQLAPLRRIGLQTILITGDNPTTAAVIAREIGIEQTVAQKTAADKLTYIKAQQADGHRIAMIGDGLNDAPALAQAEIGLSFASGSVAAKEAANLIDMHEEPGKLYQVVCISRQLSATRFCLAVFSVCAAIAKCLVVVPAVFATAVPALAGGDVLGIGSPRRALLALSVVNTLVLICLIPTAFFGVRQLRTSFVWLNRGYVSYALLGLLLPVFLLWFAANLIRFLHIA